MTSVACLSAVSIDETFSAMECTGIKIAALSAPGACRLGCDTLAVAIGDIVMVVLRYHRFCEKQFFFVLLVTLFYVVCHMLCPCRFCLSVRGSRMRGQACLIN